jgi:dolichyl-phosphate beta-glucosyltransferase
MVLSIIIPCYNEAKCIKENIQKIVEYLSKFDFEYEIIPVNDGSTDETMKVLQSIDYQNVMPIHNSNNSGKGYAVKCGIDKAEGDYILFMDADLSTDLTAIDVFLTEIKSTDIVIGSRRHKDSIIAKLQGGLRKFMGNCCIKITTFITGLKLQDTQCGFKGFKKEVAKKIIDKQTINGWAFDVEYLYIASMNNYSIKEIPIKWTNDEDSKVSPFSSSIEFFNSLIKIRSQKKLYEFN